MNLFNLGLILALLFIAVVGMGYLLHDPNPPAKQRKPRRRINKSWRKKLSDEN